MHHNQIPEFGRPEFTYPLDSSENQHKVADKRFKQLGGLERRPSPITLATDSRTPSPLMSYYNSSAQGQGGYNGQRQPQAYAPEPSNRQGCQGGYNNQYAAEEYQGDYNNKYALQQQDNHSHQRGSQHHGEYNHHHGSQQGFQPGSSVEPAGPTSHASDHQQSRRHRKNNGSKNGVRMILESFWECHICETAYNFAIHNVCTTPDCYGHTPCQRCTQWTQEVPYDM
ncbi:uncharacterized protein DFL_006367 [Arthrobotrys flagrans]|uniref:Uncharacterized protein n=1 Tax=Arthrobotrys flagrans TaxID=97331 RepID=A0A437A066_ARTFL|nr:hypothetical protein DFL_006367 [Arthrobotrys flagrans]